MRYSDSKILMLSGSKGDVRYLRKVLRYLKPYKLQIAIAMLALLVTSTAVLGMGKGFGYLIDEGFNRGNPDMLNRGLACLMIVTAVLALATYARFYFVTMIGERVVADMRRDIYNHIVNLSADFFEKTKAGDILSRMTSDTAILQTVIGSSISIAMRNTLMLLGGSAMLVYTSPKLAMIVALVIPVVVFPIIILGKKVRRYSKINQEKAAMLASHTEESINGIKTIQSFVREDLESRHFAMLVNDSLSSAAARIRLRSLLTAIVILFVFGAVVFVLWTGGHDVLSGEMTPGQLSSFLFYSVIVAGSTGAISEVAGDLQRAAGSAERILELLGTAPSIKSPANPKEIKGCDVIKFDDVTFFYPNNDKKSSLKNFSLEIKNGETIALVGPSGAGKTTIFQLLLRFYDVNSGSVSIDGVSIKKFAIKDLRKLFGIVPQDTQIFSDTAYNNIAFGNPDASYDDVVEAARAASALSFIERLPNGFDSYLGEKGVRLSGGEKQRIAIARVFLENPRILLLDEATSALDSANEKRVQVAFENLMKNRTTIVIAHRLSTVQKADRIVVLNEGEIEEIGSHKELLKNKGLYAKLAKSQFGEA